jgi:hypothetical protein
MHPRCTNLQDRASLTLVVSWECRQQRVPRSPFRKTTENRYSFVFLVNVRSSYNPTHTESPQSKVTSFLRIAQGGL